MPRRTRRRTRATRRSGAAPQARRRLPARCRSSRRWRGHPAGAARIGGLVPPRGRPPANKAVPKRARRGSGRAGGVGARPGVEAAKNRADAPAHPPHIGTRRRANRTRSGRSSLFAPSARDRAVLWLLFGRVAGRAPDDVLESGYRDAPRRPPRDMRMEEAQPSCTCGFGARGRRRSVSWVEWSRLAPPSPARPAQRKAHIRLAKSAPGCSRARTPGFIRVGVEVKEEDEAAPKMSAAPFKRRSRAAPEEKRRETAGAAAK